jgi:hypothetical protein
MKQVRIKRWFLEKNNSYAGCTNDIRCGKHTEKSWFTVTKETEKAYHIDETTMYLWRGGWVPKSCVLEVKEG